MSSFASVFIEQVTVRWFRGIEECSVRLEPGLTVLVGRNNAGKSRLLRALAVALAAVPPDRDDITVHGTPSLPTIDIMVAPLVVTGQEQSFDARSRARLGKGIQAVADEPVVERFVWRTAIRPSADGGVRTDTAQLIYNTAASTWDEPKNPTGLTADQRTLIAATLIDTRRDLVEELVRRGSPARRVLDDLEISDGDRTPLEGGLRDLGSKIIESSGALAAIRESLETLTKSIDGMGTPRLQPLPVRLEELARSVSIDMDTGTGGLPLRLHGAGARSLASLQVQGVLYDRRLGKDGPALRPHPITLVEEPEAHLHPQAQFELPTLMEALPGQKVISTHSSHLASVLNPSCLRLLKPKHTTVAVTELRAPAPHSAAAQSSASALDIASVEKLRRLIERPFGELLFANAIVMGDGATERSLIPPLARHRLGHRAHGLCVIDPGSMGNELATAVLKFANLVGIPWLLFADSDKAGRDAANHLVTTHGAGDLSRIVWVGDPSAPKGEATEAMFVAFDADLCVEACRPLGFLGGAPTVKAFMIKHKGVLGRLLADALVRRLPFPPGASYAPGYWPAPLETLLQRLDPLLP